jgi:hypothetical protein
MEVISMLKNKAYAKKYNEAKIAKEKAWNRYREEKEFHGNKESYWLVKAIKDFIAAEEDFNKTMNEIYK